MFAVIHFDGEFSFVRDGYPATVHMYLNCPDLASATKLLRTRECLVQLNEHDFMVFWDRVIKEIRKVVPSFALSQEMDYSHFEDGFEETAEFDKVVAIIQRHEIDCTGYLQETDNISAFALVNANEPLFQILLGTHALEDEDAPVFTDSACST